MVNKTSPDDTLINLKDITTSSTRYCSEAPIPRNLAPLPPERMLLSYPIIPPSIITPAIVIGRNGFAFLPSYTSRWLRINCLSLITLSRPTRSTTLNQLLLSCNALIKKTSAPCVTAEENNAKFVLGFFWPVLS